MHAHVHDIDVTSGQAGTRSKNLSSQIRTVMGADAVMKTHVLPHRASHPVQFKNGPQESERYKNKLDVDDWPDNEPAKE